MTNQNAALLDATIQASVTWALTAGVGALTPAAEDRVSAMTAQLDKAYGFAPGMSLDRVERVTQEVRDRMDDLRPECYVETDDTDDPDDDSDATTATPRRMTSAADFWTSMKETADFWLIALQAFPEGQALGEGE
jgi:hypothetical protein